MKCGERIVRCLTGGNIDRIPFGVGLGWRPWGDALNRWRQESGDPSLDPAIALGYDSSFAIPRLESGPFPHYENKIIADEGETIVSLDWRGITMRNRKDGGSMPEFLDYPVKSPDDWNRIKQERYRLDLIDERVVEDWPAFINRIAATAGAGLG